MPLKVNVKKFSRSKKKEEPAELAETETTSEIQEPEIKNIIETNDDINYDASD